MALVNGGLLALYRHEKKFKQEGHDGPESLT